MVIQSCWRDPGLTAHLEPLGFDFLPFEGSMTTRLLGGGIAFWIAWSPLFTYPMIYNQFFRLTLLLGSEIKEIDLLDTTCFTFLVLAFLAEVGLTGVSDQPSVTLTPAPMISACLASLNPFSHILRDSPFVYQPAGHNAQQWAAMRRFPHPPLSAM